MSRWILISLLFTGCGSAHNVYEVGEFAPYVAQFEQAAADTGKPTVVNNLVIKFGEMPKPGVIAVCSQKSVPTITVSKAYWEKAKETDREILMLHELGHCILGRNHVEVIVPVTGPTARVFGNRAKSLMNPCVIPSVVYEAFRDEYLNELFNG